VSLKDDIYADLPTIFFNPADFAELHEITLSDGSLEGTKSRKVPCQFDSDELLRLKEAFTQDTALARASVLLLINEDAFPQRPRARQTLIVDDQVYSIERVDWALGMLSIALSAGKV
jgi:hypothetical protein